MFLFFLFIYGKCRLELPKNKGCNFLQRSNCKSNTFILGDSNVATDGSIQVSYPLAFDGINKCMFNILCKLMVLEQSIKGVWKEFLYTK